jgi:hypothetical protein
LQNYLSGESFSPVPVKYERSIYINPTPPYWNALDIVKYKWILVFRKVESLQPAAHSCSPLVDYSTLKMEAIRSSKTSVYPSSTQCNIPEDNILQDINFLRSSDWFRQMQFDRLLEGALWLFQTNMIR